MNSRTLLSIIRAVCVSILVMLVMTSQVHAFPATEEDNCLNLDVRDPEEVKWSVFSPGLGLSYLVPEGAVNLAPQSLEINEDGVITAGEHCINLTGFGDEKFEEEYRIHLLVVIGPPENGNNDLENWLAMDGMTPDEWLASQAARAMEYYETEGWKNNLERHFFARQLDGRLGHVIIFRNSQSSSREYIAKTNVFGDGYGITALYMAFYNGKPEGYEVLKFNRVLANKFVSGFRVQDSYQPFE